MGAGAAASAQRSRRPRHGRRGECPARSSSVPLFLPCFGLPAAARGARHPRARGAGLCRDREAAPGAAPGGARGAGSALGVRVLGRPPGADRPPLLPAVRRSGEAGAGAPSPGQEETHRGGLHPRLDGVRPRARAQQHPALRGEGRLPPARELPQAQER